MQGGCWQVFFFEHSVESLACGGPSILGKIHRGLSTWRALSKAETAAYGGSSLRKLFGCAITMFNTSNAGLPLSVLSSDNETLSPPGTPCTDSLFPQLLLTWSKVNLPCVGIFRIRILLNH